MGSKSLAARELQRQVEAAVLAEVERVGVAGFRAEATLRPFFATGLSRSTGHRWVRQLLDSGRAGSHLTAKVREVVADRAGREDDLAGATAREVAEFLPRPVTPAEIMGGSVVSASARLAECVALAEVVIAKCRAPDGTIRLVKTALTASEHIRRCVETSIRIAEAVRSISAVDAFHRAVLTEVAMESPECAARILQRLQHLNTTWGQSAPSAR